MRIVKDDGIDDSFFYSALNSDLDLVCGDRLTVRNKINSRLEDKLENIIIFSKENSFVTKKSPGSTIFGINMDNVLKKERDYLQNIKVLIYDPIKYDVDSSKELSGIYAHELFHTLSLIVPGMIKSNSIIYEDSDNSLYINAGGKVEKISSKGNEIYGHMFNETLTEMLGIVALSYRNSKQINNGINANTILKEKYTKWNDSRSAYIFFTSLTRLALAAFSNDPDEDFDNIVKTKNSIFFAKREMKNKEKYYRNDLLYGYLANPLHIKEKFEEIEGPHSYDYFMLGIDEVFNYYLSTGNMDYASIKAYMMILPDFMNKKMDLYKKIGLLSFEEADKLISNFNIIWNEMQEEFGVHFTGKEISNFRFFKRLQNKHQLPYEKK